MYCRNCGNELDDNDIQCPFCSTKKGEGAEYCHICGHITNERTKYCYNCGAKLTTVLPKKVQNERKESLQKQAKSIKFKRKCFGFIMVGSAVAVLILILLLVFRPQPNNIPTPFYVTYTDGVAFGDRGVYAPDDYMAYADENVQEYWSQSRTIIYYIVICIFVFIMMFIYRLALKSAYKRTLKKLKEVQKDVL